MKPTKKKKWNIFTAGSMVESHGHQREQSVGRVDSPALSRARMRSAEREGFIVVGHFRQCFRGRGADLGGGQIHELLASVSTSFEGKRNIFWAYLLLFNPSLCTRIRRIVTVKFLLLRIGKLMCNFSCSIPVCMYVSDVMWFSMMIIGDIEWQTSADYSSRMTWSTNI